MPELNVEDEGGAEIVAPPKPSIRQRLMALVWKSKEAEKMIVETPETPPGLYFFIIFNWYNKISAKLYSVIYS